MPASYENKSYAGIIEALNQVALYNGQEIQSYEPNFNGIIAAILNLGQLGDASLGDYPPFWEIETDDDGNIIGGDFNRPPTNGDLWFDTRQGRLMVYVDDAYYQTNGADALTTVGTTQPTTEVVGALWYNPSTGSLFVYDGTVWNNVTSSSFSTTNLPLSLPTQTRSTTVNGDLPELCRYPPGTQFTQATLNEWLIRAIGELDDKGDLNATAAAVRETAFSTTAPTSPVAGHVWYDTSAPALKVYNGTTWVAATDLVDVLQRLTDVEDCEEEHNTYNLARFLTIENSIASLPFGDYATNAVLNGHVSTLTTSINDLTTTVGDLTRFKLVADADSEHTAIESRLTTLENDPGPDLSGYATDAELAAAIATLEADIVADNYATETYVTTAIAALSIPDVSGKVDTSTFTQYQSTAANTYVSKSGSTITGKLTLDYADINHPTLDFSTSFGSGIKAIAIKANSATNPAYFGTSSTANEIAWQFSGSEEFKWKHNNTDVMTITQSGVSTPALTVNGVDVGAKLTEITGTSIAGLQTSFSTLQSDVTPLQTAVAALQANVNIYYQDAAPTTGVVDGNLWFDSLNLRLNVRHGGAWVFPDRVEDVQLKSDLLNAVNTSTDYASLKANLISALS